jgi:hypothetical protein
MMNSRQQRGVHTLIAWLLSWALILSPMLATAKLGYMPTRADHPSMGGMPCHQSQTPDTSKHPCPHCDENGLSLLCDCCDQAVPQTLLTSQGGEVCLTLELGETFRFILQTRSDPPPSLLFRPPIHS